MVVLFRRAASMTCLPCRRMAARSKEGIHRTAGDISKDEVKGVHSSDDATYDRRDAGDTGDGDDDDYQGGAY